MTNTYDIGDTIRLTATFTVSDAVTDPTTITLKVKDPVGTITSYTYAAGTVTKASTGVYTKDIALTLSGPYFYRWEGTGTVPTADETWLDVEKSQF